MVFLTSGHLVDFYHLPGQRVQHFLKLREGADANFAAMIPEAEWWTQVVEAARQLHWTETLAVLLGVVYVVLAARGSRWCWPPGIVSCALWAWATFTLYNLWVDALLQLFYVAMGVWGWYHWKPGGAADELPITTMRAADHLRVWGIGLPLALLFGWFFDTYTPAAATWLDAFTTVFAILTTWLVVEKKLENWLYWVLVDSLYVYLYARQGAWLFMLLMMAYTLIAISGWFRWRRLMEQRAEQTA